MSGKCSILFIHEKCIQCHGCEVACKSWRNVEVGVNWRKVKISWNGDYPDSKMVPVMVACLQCTKPACAAACPTKAIKKEEDDGVVLVNREECFGCQACLEACPYNVPQFGLDGKMQKCDRCIQLGDGTSSIPPCVATCPTQALQLVFKINRSESV